MLMPLKKNEKPSPPIKKELSRNELKKRKKQLKTKGKKKKVSLKKMKRLNIDAAGIDVGAKEMYVCVPEDRDSKNVRIFKTFTADLYDLADWLESCSIKTVAMESTGVYWIPTYQILENRGFDVNLVNARHIKNVPGKKTDIEDCQWIQELHTYGLLSSSFRPEEDMCALRSLTRHREMLNKHRSIHIQHMQKNLELMNIKLCSVLKDITGVTGMQIIRAIVKGERDSVKLAQFRDPNCHHTEEEIAKSLEGFYRSEHLFALTQAFNLYDHYTNLIKLCDLEIKEKYTAHKSYKGDKTLPAPQKRMRKQKNAPSYDLRTELYKLCGVDLCRIDGINVLTAQTILTEIGIDMSKWASSKHFASWLGLSPVNKISGGVVLKRGSKKTTNPVTLALRKAATSLSRSKSALGSFYRRIRAKSGAMKANKATAHKLARIIYNMLKNKTEYDDPGDTKYLEEYRRRNIKNLQRKAAFFGLKLVEAE